MTIINYKTSRRKLGGNLHVTGLGDDLQNMKPKSQATKAKLDKWGYTKLKSYCTGKETLSTE